MNCKQCGKILTVRQKKFCSNKCHIVSTTRDVMVNCKVCGDPFQTRKWKVDQGRLTCSPKCRGKAIGEKLTGENNPNYDINKYINKNCLNCNTSFKVLATMMKKRKTRGQFCNKKCYTEYSVKNKLLSKEKNPNWRGGKSFELYPEKWNENIKHTIRNRDKFTCKICGKNGWQVHHIDYNKHNLEYINLITLCRSCHMKTNFKREYWINYFKIILDKSFGILYNSYVTKTEDK